MKNTNTVRTLSFALAAIMLFSAALLGGAYALAMNESAQPYEQDGFTPYIGSKIPSKTVYISTYEHDTMLNSWISNDFIASDSAAKEVVISYEAMTFEESADAFAPGQSALKFMFEHISNGAFEAVVLSISEDGTAFIIRLDSSYTQLSADWYSATDGFDFDVFQSAYDNRVLSLTGEAPSTQTEMQMKFSVYNHVSADGATLTLFSQKQAQTLHESTDNALTYDEVLFLMNDSIKLYETYDTVCLTNAFEYGFVPDDIVRQSESHYVECLHTDYSSLSYNSANAQYLQKIRDISLIVRYRLLMLDSGFEKGYITLDSLSGMYGFSQKLYLGDAIDEIKNERRESFYFISSHFQFANDCYVMLIDTKGELDTAEKYAAALAEEFEACSTAWYDPYSRSYSYPALADAELEYPLIVLSDGYIFNQTCVFYKNSAVCVPTPELADKDPHKWKLTESYFDTDHIVISLTGNDQFGSVVLADIKDDDAKALIDMLKNAHTADMYLLQSTLYAVDSLFYYELYLNNGTTIILPVNDPSGELAAIEPSNSEYETSYFNKCVSLQFTAAVNELCWKYAKPFVDEYIDSPTEPVEPTASFTSTLADIPDGAYTNFENMMNVFIAKTKEDMSLFHDTALILETDAFKELRDLITGDTAYKYIAVNECWYDRNDFWKTFLLQIIIDDNAELSEYSESVDLYTEQGQTAIIEKIVSDPETYLK